VSISKKYCKGCGHRLVEPDQQGNLHDGAFWKWGNRCLECRLKALFARFGL
jgi:hypothetical protein